MNWLTVVAMVALGMATAATALDVAVWARRQTARVRIGVLVALAAVAVAVAIAVSRTPADVVLGFAVGCVLGPPAHRVLARQLTRRRP